jgi:hypothetical protein
VAQAVSLQAEFIPPGDAKEPKHSIMPVLARIRRD